MVNKFLSWSLKNFSIFGNNYIVLAPNNLAKEICQSS